MWHTETLDDSCFDLIRSQQAVYPEIFPTGDRTSDHRMHIYFLVYEVMITRKQISKLGRRGLGGDRVLCKSTVVTSRHIRFLSDIPSCQNVAQGRFITRALQESKLKNSWPHQHCPYKVLQAPSNELSPAKQIKAWGMFPTLEVKGLSKSATRHKCQMSFDRARPVKQRIGANCLKVVGSISLFESMSVSSFRLFFLSIFISLSLSIYIYIYIYSSYNVR